MHETIQFLTIRQVRFKYTGEEEMVANKKITWRLGDRLSSSKLARFSQRMHQRRRLSYLIPKHFLIDSEMNTAKIQRNPDEG